MKRLRLTVEGLLLFSRLQREPILLLSHLVLCISAVKLIDQLTGCKNRKQLSEWIVFPALNGDEYFSLFYYDVELFMDGKTSLLW